ncbi:hypothetical protein GIB67_036501 [Kingdonia uniflora]|uniref:Uncharacterized protein n=1 Tax=Kingdonia uniflora TaxID=39325 RepID=A0A7J7P7U6_9MAGN|nr:hypothetical protein GIB67_036501 [Kingdonia uniflora]
MGSNHLYDDVWEPTRVSFNRRFHGFVVFIGDSTRELGVHFLKNETDWFDVFARWKAWVEIETGSKLKRLGFNGDGDQFYCNEFVIDTVSIGIERLEKIPIILQEFGMAESVVREITERVQRKPYTPPIVMKRRTKVSRPAARYHYSRHCLWLAGIGDDYKVALQGEVMDDGDEMGSQSLYRVDIVDFNGSFLAHVRDFAGANPIILVVTKVDLLPKGTDLNCVGDWVVEATTKKKLNVLSVHLTSSKSMVGIAGVVSEIQKEKKGRDVYILGSANVGKSAFISALLKLMAQKDPVAATARKYKPIQSAVPGTTLGPIQINAFLGDGKLYDTPGVHLHHRQAAVVHSEDLPALAPQNRLRGQSFPVEASILGGFSIFWGGLVRIDALKVLTSTRLTFYGPKALQLHIVPTAEADDFYKKQLGVLLTPPTGKKRADEWAGLQIIRQVQIKSENHKRSACDIAISGLGWIAVEQVETSGSEKSDETSRELLFAVHVPKPVEIFVRAPLPVGKNGGERYEYRELTEIEEELRPKWYF